MKVLYEPESLDAAKSGAVWGDIWLQEGDAFFFPEFRWNDLIVNVLSAFCIALRDLESGIELAKVSFLDGPYSTTICGSNIKGSVLMNVDGPGFDVSNREVNYAVMRDSIIVCSGDVYNQCLRRGWGARREVMELGQVLRALG